MPVVTVPSSLYAAVQCHGVVYIVSVGIRLIETFAAPVDW